VIMAWPRYPRRKAAASLKPVRPRRLSRLPRRYPRRKAAASLKPTSAAGKPCAQGRYPRRKAAASLKPRPRGVGEQRLEVIRGERPRPH